MQKGIIISVQGYRQGTTQEIVENVVNAGACAVRIDKPVKTDVPIIGLNKSNVINKEKEAYITNTIEQIQHVSEWANYVAIDYRILNKNLKNINEYCRLHKIKVIADIGHINDFNNIVDNDYYFDFVTTALSIFRRRHYPDLKLLTKKPEPYP